MSNTSPTKLGSSSLFGVKASLDSLALELLKGRFPKVDVEPYYRAAEAYINENMRRNKGYRRNMRGNSPLETSISLAMDTVASAYVLVSGERVKKKVDRLLRDFEIMVGDYLEGIGTPNLLKQSYR